VLKIIWYFCAPSDPYGYGVVSKEICTRLIKEGHHVVIASRYEVGAPHFDGVIPVFTGINSGLVQLVSQEEGFDYIVYVYNENQDSSITFNNWVSCAAFDYEFLPQKIAEEIKKSKFQFCVSHHNQRELEKLGFKPSYCPWGVDTNLFKPSVELRKKRREKMKWDDDTFIVGTVGMNLTNDRKNHINLLKAFQKFSLAHLNVELYMHCSAFSPLPLEQIAQSLGISDRVSFIDQKVYHMNALLYSGMPEIYNGLDVLCIPSKGESFGLPLLEAQACGVPVITTDTTGGSELVKGGWLIPVDEDDYEYLKFGSWQAVVRASKIYEQLENAYLTWKNRDITFNYGTKARLGVMEYDWDAVFEKYWKPFLKVLEEGKVG